MGETDSVMIARLEEKIDALTRRIDERCDHRVTALNEIRRDVDSLKQDRARLVGIATLAGAIIAWVGNAAIKMAGVWTK